jgi:transcriptional regulator with XRE-family HTH domain
MPTATTTPGERLEKARVRAGLTVVTLAALSGVNYTTIHRAEANKRGLGAGTLRVIAETIASNSDRPLGEVLEELTRP